MISKEELKNYAEKKGIKNLGFAELDYFQNILLFIIYKRFGHGIIFKGGTALYKCYGLDRFSEDLDFDIFEEINLKKIYQGMNDFGIEYDVEERIYERSKKIVLKIKGPLYNGSKNSVCRLVLDFSLREKVEIKPLIKRIGRFLDEIPSFDVVVMAPEEILSEKFRTIFTRDKSRDIYDISFLIDLNTNMNPELVNKKLKYYSIFFDKDLFLEEIKKKKKIWNTEMKRLVENVPSFEETFKKIKGFLD